MPQTTQKTAFLFTGQGVPSSEIISFYNSLNIKSEDKTQITISVLQKILDETSPDSKFDALNTLTNADSSAWTKTDFVQPIIFTLSILAFEALNKKPDFVLGHSLGAFSAATAAGMMSIEDGMRLVAARGKFMQENSEKTNTGMVAIIGLTENQIKEICQKTNCEIALINAPTAFVLGGTRDNFSAIETEAEKLGARKSFQLTTSGAFHTPAMLEAYENIKIYKEKINLKNPQIPVVINLKGKSSTNKEELIDDLVESTIHHVNWARMMDYLKNQSVNSYVEIGPGTSLSALCRLNGIERDQVSHARTLLEQKT